jgi:hypothetical protein
MKTLLFTNGKTMLKSIMKTGFHLPMAAMFLAAVLACPAAAGNQVPFKGQSSGVATTESFDPVAGIVHVRGEGEGEATHLGHFTDTSHVAIYLATGTVLGNWTLTAANGDMLFLAFRGYGIDETHGAGTFTVVGGTGRFRGATGYYQQAITFFPGPGGTADAVPYTEVLEGTISFGPNSQ